MAAIVRASYPISFQLLNRDRQPILGIFDGQQGQTLKLDITNSSRRNIKAKQLMGNPSAENHHFEVRFRPGTLVLPDSVSPARPAISVVEPGWKISDKPVLSDGAVSFYLLMTNPPEIESSKAISVTLNNLSGDGKVGAHGTRIELKWNNSLEYVASAGQPAEPLAPGFRLQYLSVVNESGQKQIPLYIGIVGNDKVLNNDTVNSLKLRITNLIKPDPAKPGEGTIQLNPDRGAGKPPATKLIASFDFSPIAPQRTVNPWALGFQDQVAAINFKNGDKNLFDIQQPEQGKSPVWRLTPLEQISLKPSESIELKIENIKTTHPSGLTNLYIHYKNIPGYWDGDFVCHIEKAPLVYGDRTVGIGTNTPAEKLHVAGNLRVDNGEIILGSMPNQIKGGNDDHRLIFGTHDFELKGGGPITFSPGLNDNPVTARTVILTNGNVGIGTATPAKHLHVAGTSDQEIMIESTDEKGIRWSMQSSRGDNEGRFEIIDRSAGASRLTINKNGNIGIGTTTPGAYINEKDFFKADKDGRLVELHSPDREPGLIFSTAQDRDGAHLGGIYFTRTKGQKDAHREVAAIKCKQMFAEEMGGGILQFFTKPASAGVGFDKPRMVIRENGRVGIGTADPQKAALEIASWADVEIDKKYQYLNLEHNYVGKYNVKATWPYAIWAHKRVAAEEFNAFSDARLKSIHGRSDGAADLATLLGIEITDYSFKDVIGKGSASYKKVIGQQVEKVFPQAVSRATDVVPDIYQQASVNEGWIDLTTDLKQGERVKLITEKGEAVHEVLEAMPDRFRVELADEGEKVFVFGREVDDFLSVDYDAISMLNVSATQQLKKEMDQELKALCAENAELRAANDSLAQRLQLLESKLEATLGVMAAAGGANGNGRH